MAASQVRTRWLTAVLIGWLTPCSVDSNAPPNDADARNAAAASDKAKPAAVLPRGTSSKPAAPRIVSGEYLVKFRAPTGRGYAASRATQMRAEARALERKKIHGGQGRNRTTDTRIFSPFSAVLGASRSITCDACQPRPQSHPGTLPAQPS